MRLPVWLFLAAFVWATDAKELKGGKVVREQFPAPFTRLVMNGAARSIAIPLASNLHVAFDAERLRMHAAWKGERASLVGYATTAQQNPITKIPGSVLWTMPEPPWTAASNRFRGVSTKGGSVTLLYDIGDSHGWARVHETPSAASGTNNGITRRFEIGRGTDALRFVAFAENVDPIWSNAHISVLRRSSDMIVVQHSGAGLLHTARGTDHVVRVTALLPASTTAQVFEVTTFVCPTNLDTHAFAGELATRTAPVLSRTNLHARSRASSHRALEFAGSSTPGRSDGDEFYKREQIPVPKELDLLVGGLDWLPNGDLMVATWPGEIYVARGITNSLTNIVWQRFASGLHEPLGLKWRDGSAYVATKAELTRITDTDEDGEADLFETVSDAWGFDGDSHYFAYGPALDDAGNFYVPLDGNTGDWRAKWAVPMRGWALKVQPDGATESIACGLRTPNGIFFYGGDVFCTDNEGYWIGACKIDCLRKGKFFGYPSSTPHAREHFDQPLQFDPPALWFPRKLAPSATDGAIIPDHFGPFTNQLIVGDFFLATLNRVQLENVNGEWQGAVWPFMKGFLSGVNRVVFGPDGKLYVGCLRRGWSSSGPLEFSLERVAFTGKAPFEIQEVRAQRDGFEMTFTEPVHASAADTNAWTVSQFGYRYHSAYGSPEIDHDGKANSATPIPVSRVEISADKRRAKLFLSGWKTNFVTAVSAGIQSAAGTPLHNGTFYYTLNQWPR